MSQNLNTTLSSTESSKTTQRSKESQEKRWLRERMKGIGASEAASIVGMSPYKTNMELWEEKTKRRKPDDLSDNAFVQYGKEAEEPLRQLFMLDHPEYTLEYNQYKLHKNAKYPFILATLDGELTEIETGRRGILEIKTTEIMNNSQWDQWGGRLPDPYYVQVLHQLLATGWDFVELNAQIKYYSAKLDKIIRRTETYHIERADVLEDMEWVLGQEIEFWGYVQNNTRPGLLLPAI